MFWLDGINNDRAEKMGNIDYEKCIRGWRQLIKSTRFLKYCSTIRRKYDFTIVYLIVLM